MKKITEVKMQELAGISGWVVEVKIDDDGESKTANAVYKTREDALKTHDIINSLRKVLNG